jgi:hypothetical protein
MGVSTGEVMRNMDYYISKLFTEFRYNVEHLDMTQWCILGSMSAVIGFLFMRKSNIQP